MADNLIIRGSGIGHFVSLTPEEEDQVYPGIFKDKISPDAGVELVPEFAILKEKEDYCTNLVFEGLETAFKNKRIVIVPFGKEVETEDWVKHSVSVVFSDRHQTEVPVYYLHGLRNCIVGTIIYLLKNKEEAKISYQGFFEDKLVTREGEIEPKSTFAFSVLLYTQKKDGFVVNN